MHYLLSATMSSDRSLSGSTQCCSVVVEIARGIHLVLRIERQKQVYAQTSRLGLKNVVVVCTN